jgi:putative lipoic acid-binding regulatory protein
MGNGNGSADAKNVVRAVEQAADQQPQLPSLEYPLDYTFKIMGLASEDFADHARQLVEQVTGAAPADQVVVRASNQGKYLSVSVVARLSSEDQRRAVYQVLRADQRVVYYL